MKKAYATMLCTDDAYLPGVEVLGSSLKSSGTTIPMVAMVTSEIGATTREALTSQGWQIREVEHIPNPKPAAEMLPRFAAAYTKLRVWQLAEFEKVVLLDADTLVVKNVDDLFERPELSAGPDFFLPDRFNSGVMVLEPRQATFERMERRLGEEVSYDGGDQGFLNLFFEGWYAKPVEHRLPAGYNMANFIYEFMHAHKTAWKNLQQEVKIVHYMVQKPWRSAPVVTGASQIWWDAYFKVHPEKASALRSGVHKAEDRSFDNIVHWLVG